MNFSCFLLIMSTKWWTLPVELSIDCFYINLWPVRREDEEIRRPECLQYVSAHRATMTDTAGNTTMRVTKPMRITTAISQRGDAFLQSSSLSHLNTVIYLSFHLQHLPSYITACDKCFLHFVYCYVTICCILFSIYSHFKLTQQIFV